MRKCKRCRCPLDIGEGHGIPFGVAAQNFDGGINMPSSGEDKWCDDCWDNHQDEVY
jgi:hypothetical protein